MRDLGERYSYKKFENVLEQKRKDFNPAQEAGLKQRMALLESFMANQKQRATQTTRFAAGQLTIVDLSDPFIDPASACGIFEVITRLFVRAKINTGKVLVVDEAHKVSCLCLCPIYSFAKASYMSFVYLVFGHKEWFDRPYKDAINSDS